MIMDAAEVQRKLAARITTSLLMEMSAVNIEAYLTSNTTAPSRSMPKTKARQKIFMTPIRTKIESSNWTIFSTKHPSTNLIRTSAVIQQFFKRLSTISMHLTFGSFLFLGLSLDW